jgi:hypothetical protein
LKISRRQRRLRVAIKRFLYSQLYQRDSFRLMFGRAKPLVQFKVEAEPPSVYFNFELDPARVPSLEDELDLPLPLTRMRCLADDEPFHCITLNIYRVSGLANGIRAEWSLYVEDGGGTPRYLVVEAKADSPSIDSVNLVTRRGEVTHRLDKAVLESLVVAEDGGCFTSRCRNADSGPSVGVAPEWIEANDYIYWMNGICDRTFYDSGLANPRARLVDPANVEIEDTTRWGDLIVGAPRNVVVFENAIEFAMSPWWNLDDKALLPVSRDSNTATPRST